MLGATPSEACSTTDDVSRQGTHVLMEDSVKVILYKNKTSRVMCVIFPDTGIITHFRHQDFIFLQEGPED